MSSLFRSDNTQANQSTLASGVSIQSSVLGRCIPVVYGTTPVAPNLIAYGNFGSVTQGSQTTAGKGGLFTSGQNSGQTVTYFCSLVFALCMGPINTVGVVFVNKGKSSLATLGFSLFTGTYPQAPWNVTINGATGNGILGGGGGGGGGGGPTFTPLGYNGIAYIAAPLYNLGTSPALPNHKIEVAGVLSTSLPSPQQDADPSLVLADILTNVHYGCGFPSARVGDLTTYQNYCLAAGLVISVAYTEQRDTASIVDELLTATNSELVWSNGLLTVVPRGDAALAGNGKAYAPPGAPLYDLSDDDFLPNQSGLSASGSSGDDPVALVRKRPADALNTVKFEYLDRASSYAPGIAEAKDQALIDQVRVRSNGTQQMHMFASAAAAQTAAQLYLQRQGIRNQYGFTLDQRYILLDPMDIITLTDSVLGLSKQPVRILEITENDDGSLNLIAEEYLAGIGAAATYSFTQGNGAAPDINADPGLTNPPMLFELPAQLDHGLVLSIALSGINTSLWGGAQVNVSSDGASYRYVGTVVNAARMGVLSALLPSFTPPVQPPNLDTSDTLAVDLTESAGTLISGSQADLLAFNTACWVNGEIVSYLTAALTATSKYALTTLNRGGYGTPIGAHAQGAPVARLDGAIFKLPYSSDRIGQTLYLKFLSFNIYGGGLQTLAEVPAYTYTPTGSAFSAPLPAISNLRSILVAAVNNLWWDEITDPVGRPIQYEVRKGSSWAGGLVVQRQAHPPFTTHGNDTYWVAAVSVPAPGLTIYGPATSVVVNIASITFGAPVAENDYQAIAAWDEQATGWQGTFYGGAGRDTTVPGSTTIRTGGAGNILADADFLHTPNILDYGGEGSGGYVQPTQHWVNGGRPAGYLIQCDYSGQGVPVGQNILGVSDFLNDPDILGAVTTSLIDCHIEIAVAQSAPGDLYAAGDLYATDPQDLYWAGIAWGAWEKYSPGVKYGQAFKFRMVLNTTSGQVIAYGTRFKTYVFAPRRTDHYYNLNIPVNGLPIAFTPDGAAAAAAFHGGPNNNPLPVFFGQITSALAGDEVVMQNLTAAGGTLFVMNNGAAVARIVDQLNVEGY